jgi:hypothetical protein
MPTSDDGACCCYSRPGCGLGVVYRAHSPREAGGGKMRVKPDRGGSNGTGCELPTSSARRWGAIARRSALLGSTAAIALLIGQPARAVTINDAQFGNPEYVNGTSQFQNVVATLIVNNSQTTYQCTGTLINSRTVLTAAHCFDPAVNKVSFQTNALADPNPVAITSYFNHIGFDNATAQNDIAVISLSRPITNTKSH